MIEFLSQFKLNNDFTVRIDHLIRSEKLSDAIDMGYVEKWPARRDPNRGSYYPAARCTIAGRLYFKKHK